MSLKLKYKIYSYCMKGGAIFWLIETLLFLVVYGWHLRPINEWEKLADNIVLIIWFIGFLYLFLILSHWAKIYATAETIKVTSIEIKDKK